MESPLHSGVHIVI